MNDSTEHKYGGCLGSNNSSHGDIYTVLAFLFAKRKGALKM